MNRKNKPLKKKFPPIYSCAFLSLAAFLPFTLLLPLTGCAPEERTLLLPKTVVLEEETQKSGSTKDFTVKKLYTYEYETRETLVKSAFLKDCDENKINILAKETDEENILAFRQVDYRYGFYDTISNFLQFWEDWSNPSEGTFTGDLIIEKLLPSPDGRQYLVYIRSVFWERRIVWLYTLGEQEPLLLYESNMEIDGILKGSFSPSGRFVTFDVFGASTGSQHYVPIYDCSKAAASEEAPEYIALENQARLYPPAQTLHYSDTYEPPDKLLAAELFDISGNVGLLSFSRTGKTDIGTSIRYWNGAPNSFLTDMSASSLQYYRGVLLNETAALKMPYLKYVYYADENAVYFLEDMAKLLKTTIEVGAERTNEYIQFPNVILDFLRLDTGDLLVMIAQDFGVSKEKNNGFNANMLLEENIDSPLFIQRYWDILSADLYLYPAGETEGKLLYKNVQNLISMEYCEETRRILLETYEEPALNKRKCIILEL